MVSFDDEMQGRFLHRISGLERDMLQINPFLNPSSVEVFTRQWTTLAADLIAALESGSLNIPTITAAYSVSGKVTKMVQSLSDLDALSSQLMSTFLDESGSFTSAEDLNPASVPPYIKQSHNWLVKNISNPYPPASVRDAIAQQSGTIRRDVDNWFVDARKRIGWNAARKAHFGNKRFNIIDAATRFYANDEKLSLSPGAEHALISIAKSAKDLYRDKFNETALAGKLDAAVKDLTPETKAEAKAWQMRESTKDRESYPSPGRSPEPTRSSPVPCDEEDSVVIQPMSVNSRKRRELSVEPTEPDEECRPKKRSRYIESSITHLESSPSHEGAFTFPIGLPSPAPSVDESLQVSKPTISHLPSPSPVSPVSSVSASRKRRSSEYGDKAILKRRRHLPAELLTQTISHPSPFSDDLSFDETSFEGWFQQILGPPEVGEINSSGFSVELGNLSDFNCETSADSRSEQTFKEQTFKPLTSEVSDTSTVLDVPWNEFDFVWTDHSSLSSNNVGQSNPLVNLLEQEPQPKPLAQDLVNFQMSSQATRPTHDFESFFGLSNPSIVNPLVIPFNRASSETWDFPESSFNSDDVNIFEKHNVGFERNNGSIPSFDFTGGTDSLPSSNSIFMPALTLTPTKTRQEKEKEFREACQKAQRLALELQKEELT